MKYLTAVAVALAAVAAIAGATVDPARARSDLTEGDPSLAISGDQLKGLWNGADSLDNDELVLISSDNGEYYDADQTQPSSGDEKWIIVRFYYDGEVNYPWTLRWEAYTDSHWDYPCKVYVWDGTNPEHVHFELLDTGPYPIFTTPRSVTLPAMYWHTNDLGFDECLILITSHVLDGYKTMHVDVVEVWEQ